MKDVDKIPEKPFFVTVVSFSLINFVKKIFGGSMSEDYLKGYEEGSKDATNQANTLIARLQQENRELKFKLSNIQNKFLNLLELPLIL